MYYKQSWVFNTSFKLHFKIILNTQNNKYFLKNFDIFLNVYQKIITYQNLNFIKLLLYIYMYYKN